MSGPQIIGSAALSWPHNSGLRMKQMVVLHLSGGWSERQSAAGVVYGQWAKKDGRLQEKLKSQKPLEWTRQNP